MIAAFFTDLYPPGWEDERMPGRDQPGQIWFYTNADQGFAVVSWIDVPHISDAGRHTFQVVIRRDGSIWINYRDMGQIDEGWNYSVGIQNANRNDGLSIVWRVEGQGDNIPQAENAFGIRRQWIIFEGPGILVEPEELDFGLVYLGEERTIRTRITNVGAEDLVITGWEVDNDAFILPDFPGDEIVIASEEFIEGDVIFRPQEAGEYHGTATIFCNAENAENGEFPIAMHGVGAAAPAIVVDPLSIEDDLNTGETSEHIVNIANEGESPLEFTTDLEIIREPDLDRPARHLREVAVRGPRRDQPESRYAYFIDEQNWWGNYDQIWQDAEAQVERFTSNQFADAPIEDFDCVWIKEYQSDQFTQRWNENRARFEEWVDRGGAMYQSTATNNWG
ncbi:MAG: hypothetical protein ACK4OO_06565, partial [bacterium]